MEPPDIFKKMKDREDENRRLKQMITDLSLKNRALKDVIEKSLKTSDKASTRLARHAGYYLRAGACTCLTAARMNR